MKDHSPSANSSVIAWRIAIVMACALLGLLLASYTETYFPKQYRSTVTLQIQEIKPPAPLTVSKEPDRKFLAEQFRLIQSKEILYPVIDALQLQNCWAERFKIGSREQAYHSLTSMIRLTAIRNTELIQISITENDSNKAAEIANAIAVEYQRNRVSVQTAFMSEAFTRIKEDIENQKQKIEKLRKAAAEIRAQESEADRSSGLLDESLSLTVGSPRYIEAQKNYLEAKKRLEEIEQRLQIEMVNTRMPTRPVTIWEKAEPTDVSISLPAPLRLTAGIILGTLVGLLLCLFIRR